MDLPSASLPEVVIEKARTAGAGWWLSTLDGIVEELCARWELTLGAALRGGTEAYVVAASRADGLDCVLKVLVPRSDRAASDEATVLGLCAGTGCARLLAFDPDAHALLIERLGPSLHDLGLPVLARHEILCETASRVWRRAEGTGLPTGRDKAVGLAAFIVETWESLGRPCDQRVVDHALACAQRRADAYDEERAVLLHGDVHAWNALRSKDGFLLVDPDGLVAEAEYDLGVVMREDPLELLEGDPRRRSRWLARRCGLDEAAIWEWGVVERVSTGLLCAQVGLEPHGRDLLGAAAAVAP